MSAEQPQDVERILCARITPSEQPTDIEVEGASREILDEFLAGASVADDIVRTALRNERKQQCLAYDQSAALRYALHERRQQSIVYERACRAMTAIERQLDRLGEGVARNNANGMARRVKGAVDALLDAERALKDILDVPDPTVDVLREIAGAHFGDEAERVEGGRRIMSPQQPASINEADRREILEELLLYARRQQAHVHVRAVADMRAVDREVDRLAKAAGES
jgi:hypothetical protein